MPADYLSWLPSANTDKRAKITECFDPFQPDCKRLTKTCKILIISQFMVNGQKTYQNQKQITYKTWHSNIFKMLTTLFGFSWTITNIHEWHFTYQKNIENWLYARHIIINSGDTMQHSKHTFGFLPHITGLKCTQTFSITLKHASDASKERNQRINLLYSNLCQLRANPTSGST
jgi:hypothetical protein